MDLRHVAFIPDGNRRFARKLGISYSEAYKRGFEKAREVVVDWRDVFDDLGTREITLWALSTENLKRSRVELRIIFSYIKKALSDALANGEIDDYKVGLRFVGDLSPLPEDVRAVVRRVEDESRKYKDLVVNVAIGYGGRHELLNAFKKLASSGLEFTEENLRKFLYIPSYPDLIIRTSGTIRTSGFMPWQAAYSEWYFSDKLWPEFDRPEMNKAINDYFSRERRFGR